MVLNMADFFNSWKSFETLWNASKTVLKLFVIASAPVCFDLGWIPKGRKLADFEKKAWAIAHGFKHGRFLELREIVRNSLKRLQNRSKTFCDCSRDCLCRFRVNSQKSKIGDFEQRAWALNMADFGKSWKSFQTLWNASKTVLKLFVIASATVCVDLGWIPKGRKLADFEKKASAIAHGFEHGRFFELLESVQNSLKRLQNRSKLICDCFRDCLCRFRVNSQKSKIGRFWAKGLGYSPWLWTWPILASPGNRSKLFETPPKPF